MKTITIDRSFGSGGREVGLRLSALTGMPFFDNDIILKAAENFGVDVGVLKNNDEHYVGSLIYNLSMFPSEADFQSSPVYKTYYAVSETVRRLRAEHEGGIFLGRCADVILEGECPLVRAFIYSSSMEKRVSRTLALEDVSEEKAESFIQQKDKQRRNYYQFFTDNKWGAPTNYDILLNTATVSYDECARLIAALAGC